MSEPRRDTGCDGSPQNPSGSAGAGRRAISRRALAALPIDAAGKGMITRAVSVAAHDVVFVKGVVEASDGLASVFAERGGELVLASPHGREVELGELLRDLATEIALRVDDAGDQPVRGEPRAGGVSWNQALRDQ